jgi:hypothetical protein
MAKDPAVLEHSTDRQLLMKTATEFALSPHPADHNVLLRSLESESFLSRLDSAEDYLAPPKQLRLARIMMSLMKNPAPSSKEVLVSLTQEARFVSFEPRQELLIRALVSVRPAPLDAARFWNEHSQPESPYLHLTIFMLADNGSPNALILLERKMADPNLEADDKISWMRDPILRHRNEVPMLETCARMLGGSLPADLRPRLVEALCDYRIEWYLSCEPPVPPPRHAMSEQARALLGAICNRALKDIPLEPQVEVAVETTLREIGQEKNE